MQEKLAYEFKGHSLLEAARQADLARVKKNLTTDSVMFLHPHTNDTVLHCAVASPYPKRRQVKYRHFNLLTSSLQVDGIHVHKKRGFSQRGPG